MPALESAVSRQQAELELSISEEFLLFQHPEILDSDEVFLAMATLALVCQAFPPPKK